MSATVDQATPSPAPELAELAFFIGSWEADGTFHATPFSAEKPIAMRDVEPLHRGFWIRTRTTEQPSPDNLNPLTATYLWGYDPEAGRFSADRFDSNGGYRFTLRDTFTRRDDDAYHHLGEIDLGQGWIPVDEERAHRRRGASRSA